MITKLRKKPTMLLKKKKVVAYCRVSTLSEEQESSYALQVSYFTRMIQSHPEWEFAGVYADHGISGTGTKKRVGFQEMMKAADEGKIDLILTKSIKRFARNTVDLLSAIRHLKEIGVEVRFEQENISTFSEDGDLMLTLLAAFAQDESRSLSENIKWAVKKHFENGIPWTLKDCYGYVSRDGQLHPQPEQAPIVKRIYQEFLARERMVDIVTRLNEEGVLSFTGSAWTIGQIRRVLENINYTGNLLLQKTYTAEPGKSVSKLNKGELDQYFVPDTHEVLISMDDWQQVQKMLKSIPERKPDRTDDPFQGKVFCGQCGSTCWLHDESYICSEKIKGGRTGIKTCQAKSTPKYALEEAVEGLKDDEWERITIFPERRLVVLLTSGEEHVHQYRSRAYDSRKGFYENRKKGMMFRATNHMVKLYGELACFVKCEECGENYVAGRYKPKDPEKLFFSAPCKHEGAPRFRKGEMKKLIADVLGIDEFDVEVMDANLSHCTISGKRVTFYFHDGREEVRYLNG